MTHDTDHSPIPLAGVLGYPASHSLSPLLHGHWLKSLRLSGHYVPLECAPENLADVVKTLVKTGFRGFNVTVPHKEAVFPLVDVASARAKHIGAINTIWLEDGALYGDITDGDGFLACLPEDVDLSCAVMIGAGGAAKAIAYVLCASGKTRHLTIVNRTQSRAHALVTVLEDFFPDVDLNSTAMDGVASALSEATLLINSTSLGMVGQGPLEVDLSSCPKRTFVYDIVYTPAETPLLAQASRLGLAGANGLGMLIEQARPGFARWFGADPPHTGQELALLQKALGQAP